MIKKQEITREAARRRVYKWTLVKVVQMIVLIVMTFVVTFMWSLV